MTKVFSQKQVSRNFVWATKIENFLSLFFQSITICPIRVIQNSFKFKTKFEKSSRWLALLGIIGILLYFTIIVCLRILFVNPQSELGIWYEVTNIFVITITCLVILVETQLTHEHCANLHWLKHKTENELKLLCSRELFEKEKYLCIMTNWRMLMAFHVMTSTIDIINFLNIERDPLRKFYCGALFIPITISRLRFFQHRLHTSTLNFHIKMVRMKIENSISNIDNHEKLIRQQYRQTLTFNSQKILFDLNLTMRIFTSIFRMTLFINKMFGLSLLMIILQNFIQLLTNLFWIYSKLYREDLENLTGLKLLDC